jgi:hypothetical protein
MSTCRRRTIQLSKNAKYRKRRFSSDLVATATADIGRQPADAEFEAHIFRCGNKETAGSTSPKLNLKSNNTLQRRSVAPQAVARLVWVAWNLGRKQVGKFSSGEPTCFKPYPKALFVSSSSFRMPAPPECPYSSWQFLKLAWPQKECKRNFLKRFLYMFAQQACL